MEIGHTFSILLLLYSSWTYFGICHFSAQAASVAEKKN